MKIINYLLRYFGIQFIAIPYLSDALMTSTRTVLKQTAAMDGSGEYKRAQALRALMNITGASERDCALAIELALCSE